MASTLNFGHAPTVVIQKFNEFASVYTTVTAALDALLLRDQMLEKKYRFIQDDQCEPFDITGTMDDTETKLEQIQTKFDNYIQCSKLASCAAAIEELLFSPDIADDRQNISEGESSPDEQLDLHDSTVINGGLGGVSLELVPILSEISDSESKQILYEKKRKRKSRKPKKHKKKHYDEESFEEDELRKKRPKDVWRRVGSKYIGWYTCILCNKQMRNEEDYMQHMKNHGDAHSPACMDCGNYFETMVAYEDHIGNLGKVLIFECDEEGCGKSFQFKCRLDCHKRSHTGQLMYECNDCGHKLSSIRSIIRHTRAKHLNEKPFACHICDKAFAIQSQLTRHIKDHISPPHFTCEQCGRIFSSRQGHHYHQLDHAGIKPHKCSICGKAFRNKTDMVNHERIHSGDRPFTCELCGKSFVEKGALRKHRVVHTREKNFVCSNCGKQFGYKCSLDGHLRKCQQDVSLLSMPQMSTPQHEKPPLQLMEDTPPPVTATGDLSTTAPSHDSRDRMNMYPCTMSNYPGMQHNMIPKTRNNHHSTDDIQIQVSKGQGARLMKKTMPYRQLTNHHPNASKQGYHDKQMQDQQMYSTYSVPIPHQRESTIDPDILSVLGQKVTNQPTMEQIHYNDRMTRDDGHHYRSLNQQERDVTAHMLDVTLPTPSTVPNYNTHRHSHPPQSSDDMIFPIQVRGHHFRQ